MMNYAFSRPQRHSSFLVHRYSFRAGVSLLEVLIAIFVIMFGLVGVAAMLPLGRYFMNEIEKIEYTTSCGEAAVQEVERRGMPYLSEPATGDPNAPNMGRFVYRPATNVERPYPDIHLDLPPSTQYLLDPFDRPMMLDPIGYKEMGDTGTWFPYTADPYQLNGNGVGDPADMRLPRVTFRISDPVWTPGTPPTHTPAQQSMTLAMADRIFKWRDDVELAVPKELDERPRQTYLSNQYDGSDNYLGRTGWALPWATADSAATPARLDGLYGQFLGDYSWMVMITPNQPAVDAQDQRQFNLSVIVFHKRDANTATAERPLERTVWANMIGGGITGGDVTLTTTAEPSYLDVKVGQWLMLCGVDQAENRIYRWYRVIGVERDVVPEPLPPAPPVRWTRHVTLLGQDWTVPEVINPGPPPQYNDHWCNKVMGGGALVPVDSDGDGNVCDVIAVLVDGVIGVYPTAGGGENIELP